MKLIVGLGNPGEKYAKTRHNAGWIVLEWFVGDDKCWSGKRKLKASVCRLPDVTCAKPLTFMNSSGEATRKLADYYEVSLDDLLVIHDDLDLPLGEYRLQKGRGAAGHKGVQSVIDCMGSKDFWRLRVGVSRPPENVEPDDYVLQNFSKEGLKVLEDLFENKLASEITSWVS